MLMIFGIMLGLVFCFLLVRFFTRRLHGHWAQAVWISASVGVVPGLYSGIILGGNFGGAYAGLIGESAIPLGIIVGLAVVMSLTVLLFILVVLSVRAIFSRPESGNVET